MTSTGGQTGTDGLAGNGGTPIGTGGTTSGTDGIDLTRCVTPKETYAWANCNAATGGTPTDYPFALDAIAYPDWCHTQFVVPVAPEGTPPTVTDLCAAAETPTSSGWAARITLTESNLGDGTATGRITLATELASAKVTTVELTVVDHDTDLGNIVIGTIVKQDEVFVFPLTIQNPRGNTARFPRLILTAKLSLDCNGTTRSVISTTALYRCDDLINDTAWISSGNACGECAVICEMAASPIVPPVSETKEPLSQAVRAQVARVGQYGSALLLQAQHDGGADRFTYQWDVSSGRILWQEKDLLLWEPTPSAGEHLLQVSLLSEDAAAVASSRLRCHPLGGA